MHGVGVFSQRHCRVLVLITASMRQLMEEAELLQLAVRVKQVQLLSSDCRTSQL